MPPPLNNPAFSLPSTILGPTVHPRPSGYGPSTSSPQLHHLLPPLYPLPISTANSSLNAQPSRNDMPRRCPPIFTAQIRTRRGKPKAICKRLGNVTKSKHGVILYASSGDDKATHRAQVPQNFRGLHPQISLARIRSRPQLYCRPLGIWVGVDAGYVVELRA